MKRSLALLLLAVLIPAIVLGWLALRSVEEQQIVLERRTAELYQKETEGVAASARALVEGQRRDFSEAVERLLARTDPAQLAGNFTEALNKEWPQKAVGFAINGEGRLLCPTARDASVRYQCQEFLWDNGAFIGNKTIATVYPVPSGEVNRPEQAVRNSGQGAQSQIAQSPLMLKSLPQHTPVMSKTAPAMSKEIPSPEVIAGKVGVPGNGLLIMKDSPQVGTVSVASQQASNSARNVVPLQNGSSSQDPDAPPSQLTWATGDFRQLTAEGLQGAINRFVQDRLDMIFWLRTPQATGFLFGCLIQAEDLKSLWSAALPASEAGGKGASAPEFILAVLDEKAKPVAVYPTNSGAADWKHPFVASEIGEALPHWEATLYLLHPERLQQSARRIRYTLLLLVAAALTAIACGGGLLILDTRRQLALAQKKTDFVSNVSHELKTPLTSIRMFAELMHDGRADSAKQAQYLRIITVEAERLTRLINNVLDFAKPERRQGRVEKRPIDLHAVLARVWETHEPNLRDHGFVTRWEAAPAPYPVLGDEDALTQVLVNLLSNAEKYSGDQKEINVHSYLDGAYVHVSVLDRGCGVPAGEEARIFDAFYRAHDSLASGIQGAGLGLTLAQRLAREHEGEILFQPRPGGGSNFTLKLRLAPHL